MKRYTHRTGLWHFPAAAAIALLATTAGFAEGQLSPSLRLTVQGGHVAEGTGLEGLEQASITIDSIPDGAEVVGGVLYWSLGSGAPYWIGGGSLVVPLVMVLGLPAPRASAEGPDASAPVPAGDGR